MQKEYRKKCGKSEREGKGEEREEWIVENYENKKERLKKENTRLKRRIKYWRKRNYKQNKESKNQQNRNKKENKGEKENE